MKKHKKGFLQDILFVSLVVCILGIVIFFGTKVMNDVNTSYQTTSASNTSKLIFSDASSRMTPVFDSIFLIVFVLSLVGVIFALIVLRLSPVALILVIILVGFVLIPIAILGNMFNTVQNDTSIVATATGFSITSFLMDHFVLIIIGFIFIAMVVAYARP